MAEERERARALLFLVLLVLVILGGLLGVFMRKIGHEQDTGSAFLQNLPLGTTVKEWQEGYSHITVTIQKSAVIEEQKKEK